MTEFRCEISEWKYEIVWVHQADLFSTLNASLELRSRNASQYRLKTDFPRPGNNYCPTGLFQDNRLQRILQASDFDAVGNVSPFLGALADTFVVLVAQLGLESH